jgi:hypothetical protein
MRNENGCDAHQGAVSGRPRRRLRPFLARPVIAQERAHGLADTENAPLGEPTRELIDLQPSSLEQQSRVGVVRGQAHPAVLGISIRQVITDLAVVTPTFLRPQRLRGVAESIADREAEQHAAHAIRHHRYRL